MRSLPTAHRRENQRVGKTRAWEVGQECKSEWITEKNWKKAGACAERLGIVSHAWWEVWKFREFSGPTVAEPGLTAQGPGETHSSPCWQTGRKPTGLSFLFQIHKLHLNAKLDGS